MRNRNPKNEEESKPTIIIDCSCGKPPEIDTSLLYDSKFSIGCRCGGKEFTYVVRCDSKINAVFRWNETACLHRRDHVPPQIFVGDEKLFSELLKVAMPEE